LSTLAAAVLRLATAEQVELEFHFEFEFDLETALVTVPTRFEVCLYAHDPFILPPVLPAWPDDRRTVNSKVSEEGAADNRANSAMAMAKTTDWGEEDSLNRGFA